MHATRLPGLWIGTSNNTQDWTLLDQGYPMVWCVGPQCFVGDWIMIYLTPRSPKRGIAYVYRVTRLRWSVPCANKGLDAADTEYLAELDFPITLTELREHRILRAMPGVGNGFRGPVFPVKERRQKEALIGIATERAVILQSFLGGVVSHG